MSKKVLVAAGILAVLVAAYFLTQTEPKTSAEHATWSIAPTQSLEKLEVSDGAVTLVFAKEDGGWLQTEPVQAPASANAFEDVEAVFAAGIEADLTSAEGAERDAYGLTGEGVVRVRAFAGGEKIADVTVGKSVTVPNTGARRTWLGPDGEERAYRAFTTAENKHLGDVLGRKLDDWRERSVLGLSREQIEEVAISRGGETVRMAREVRPGSETADKPVYDWKIVEPPGTAADAPRISGIVSALGTFRVTGFADGVSAAAAGLEPPAGTIAIKADGKEVVLEVGAEVPAATDEQEGAAPTTPRDRYVRIAGQPYVYVASGRNAADFQRRLGELRDKSVLAVAKETVHAVRFDGPRTFTLERGADGWTLSAAELQAPVQEAKLGSLLGAFSSMRAMDFPELDGAIDHGLAGPSAQTITVQLNDGTRHLLALGNPVSAGGEDVYARVDDGLVFVLAGFTAEKLQVDPQSFMSNAEPTVDTPPHP